MLKLAVYNAPRSCDLQERQQTSDFHLREQAPGKWASIAKKNVPEQKRPNPAASRSAAQEPSPAAATAPAPAAVDAPASSPQAVPAAVLPTATPAEATAAAAAPAPKEETAEEKIKRLEMQVEALTKQRAMDAAAAAAAAAVAAPQKKKGWGPVVTPQVNGALANGFH